MSEYLQSVIKAAGGHAAPAENLEYDFELEEEDLAYLQDIGEDYEALEYEEDEERPEAPPGYHYMPNGELMRDDAHSVRDSLSAAGYLVPEEQDLADALLEIVDKHGKFNADNTGVWAGYTSAAENDNKDIGVKCGNCVFWEAPNGCKIIVAETEEAGLCRFAVLPDGAVNPKDESVVATAGSKPAPKKDQIKGSSKNPKGSASGGKSIKFSQKVVKALQKKADDHNEKHGDTKSKKTSLRTLKAVYRRGAGAFSTSHRPDQNRNSWAMARVNAFLHLLRTGSPKNSKYVTDNDLLPAAHKRSTKKSSSITSAGDPCWEGYKQVGMKKGKDGQMVPNCVPIDAEAVGIEPPITREAAEFIVSGINENYGESRHISGDLAYKVASMAAEKYSDLYGTDHTSAVVRELIDFTEYATSGIVSSASGISCSCYSDLLPEGHPDNENSSIVASALWLSGAPELEEGSREAVYASLTALDEIESLHSSYRVKALIASGSLSEQTLQQIQRLSN